MLDFLWLQISLMGLEKRRRCGDFIAAFQYTKGASKQEGSRTFTVGVGTEGNSLMGVMVSCSEVDVLGGRRGFVAECGKSLCSFLKAAIFQLERASRDRWYPLRALSCRNNWKLTSFLVIPCSGKALTDKTTVMLDFLWLQISLMGLEKRRRCGDFIAAFQYTKGASKQEGSRTFTVGVGTEGNSLMGVMVSCSEVDVLGGRRGFVAECGKSLCSFLKAAIFQLERGSRDHWYPLRAPSCRNNWKLASFLVIPCSRKALTDKTTVMLDFLWLQISLMGLEKRRRCGDFIAAFQYTKGASKQEGSRTFTVQGRFLRTCGICRAVVWAQTPFETCTRGEDSERWDAALH
ncbi:uncharacterized protein LOC121106500 isoform X2 [Gallus gallus]|uniref:uncharacterized protein LOC121106500 isoform X2 n=1 Tax=Gallus gallus TaxID=9031 RepID=UPI001AE12A68|nr:uncharacterized protein LOC121106500 isoform X2 [Gallus gallus]